YFNSTKARWKGVLAFVSRHFKVCLDIYALVNLEYFGSKFTWQKRCTRGMLMAKRLDRVMSDIQWRLAFPEATMEHLVRRHSDHNPILLRCCNQVTTRGKRSFRFQAAKCTYEGYAQVVSRAWNKERAEVFKALYNVSKETLVFNKEDFCSVIGMRKDIEARLS
ncbi:hypothetical protein AAZX31_09G069100, partial [Glycine max]